MPFLDNEIQIRTYIALEILKSLIDISDPTGDRVAIKRAYRIADRFLDYTERLGGSGEVD